MKRRCWVVFYECRYGFSELWEPTSDSFSTKKEALRDIRIMKEESHAFRNISKPIKVEEK